MKTLDYYFLKDSGVACVSVIFSMGCSTYYGYSTYVARLFLHRYTQIHKIDHAHTRTVAHSYTQTYTVDPAHVDLMHPFQT
jgi:hypothetical protein